MGHILFSPILKISTCDLQLQILQQCKLIAAVQCLTHKHVTVSVSWTVNRASDESVRVESAMMTERRRRDSLQQRLLTETVTKSACAGTRPLHRMVVLNGNAGLGGCAQGATSRVTESFIGAGTLSTVVDVGTEVGVQTCSLHGMFLHTGLYDVSLQIESVTDASSRLNLSVHDYAVCHPLHLQVCAP